MGTATMGKVIVSAKIENLDDQYMVKQGLLTPDKVRTLDGGPMPSSITARPGS